MPKTQRITALVENLFAKMPEIESARAVIITKSYKNSEHLPIILRRALAFRDILDQIPIIIREGELIVGSSTIAPRGCQTYPEYSYEWLEAEFDTVATRVADPFYISDDAKKALGDIHPYWKGKTTSDLALSNMSPEAKKSIAHNMFTVGNYFYNGIGHLSVDYEKVINNGFYGVIEEAARELSGLNVGDADYCERSQFLQAVIISAKAACDYALRYSKLALGMAKDCADNVRKSELLRIAKNCENVPKNGASDFYEACQSFWFIQQLIQLESSGHSISPGRFDQYMYPFYKKDIEGKNITKDDAQELIDCIWVKLNDLNKCRDADSAEGFSGYSLFQNLIVGGQDIFGNDVTNDLSYMCITASEHVFLPQPSLSIRVWNNTPHSLMLAAARLTRTGIGLPAYFNDEVIIPSMMSRGVSLEDARGYNIIGCVEPQAPGKTDGWHDAAFFNMCRPLELTFYNGYDKSELVGVLTGEDFDSFDAFFDAYKAQMDYQIQLLVNADNAVDVAHKTRCPLPFLSSMVSDCIAAGKSVQEGGAVYNFTGPQGFGIANVADSLYAIKSLVYDKKMFSIDQFRKAMAANFEGTGFIKQLYDEVCNLPKFGNDIDEVDALARQAAYTYTMPLTRYKNPRGGQYQAGLYPVSANVPLGAQTGATPDGRLSATPVADGVSPSAGKDTLGPTAACNSVAKLDHLIASNGTLFNMKFHPSALSDDRGLNNFVSLVRSFFDKKGMHMQFNVVDRQTLIDAQENPSAYKGLVVRVAGYSALFTTLSKQLQDDIIGRTEQGRM